MKPLPVQGQQLSKEDFLNGRHDEMIIAAGLEGVMKRNTREFRLAKRDEMIASAPDGDLIWVFGYGSLIWNPAFDYDEKRIGRLFGYHRQFCFWSTIGRGSPDAPGMMLALDTGGSCNGVVLGVKRERAEEELTSVFMREMTGETYFAKWGTVRTAEGPVKAITFVANRESENYAGPQSLEETARHIAQGCGHLGPCKDYLFNTTQHLEELGLRDPMLRKLCDLVEKRLS
ncbi:MAG: gamma-glutamylcyclotransferase [Alphaproteobacteria bacterium]|jgi:cation transport protein ChaC|nr:gamma-glutamylcyclotransferase [Alphaproteobacteria bacterium]